MPAYAEGRVYVVLNTVNEMKYVGSTVCAHSKRMGEHRSAATSGNGRPLYVAMRDLGVDKFYISLVKDYPCERKEQLNMEEGRVIRELKTVWPDGYNACVAGRGKKEHYTENKASILMQQKVYTEQNKEAIAVRYKEYATNNKATIATYKKEYAEANKEKIRTYQQAYKAKMREQREAAKIVAEPVEPEPVAN